MSLSCLTTTCSSHQNFGLMLQLLAMNSNQSVGISELARLYCQAFSATRGKKLTKELKKCLVALLQTLERWFRKSYCEFVSLFIRFLNKLKVFYLQTEVDWSFFANLLPDFSVFELKFAIFNIFRGVVNKGIFAAKSHWNQRLDELLLLILGTSHPESFKTGDGKIKWVLVARELCLRIGDIREFKTDKQCKERWLNHLNPYLRRFLFFFSNF